MRNTDHTWRRIADAGKYSIVKYESEGDPGDFWVMTDFEKSMPLAIMRG